MKICTCTHRFPSLIYYRRRQAFVEWEREREREKEMWIRISRWGAWEEGWIRSSSLITVFKLIGTYNSHSTNACLLLLLLFVRLPSPPLRTRLVCGFLLGLVGSMAAPWSGGFSVEGWQRREAWLATTTVTASEFKTGGCFNPRKMNHCYKLLMGFSS